MRRISATTLLAACASLVLSGCAGTGSGNSNAMEGSVSGERSGSMTSGTTGAAGATAVSGTTGAVDSAGGPAEGGTTPKAGERR